MLLARVRAVLPTSGRLRIEGLRILLLLRERLYLGLIARCARRLHASLVPPPAQEAALSTLATAIAEHAKAVNRLAVAVERATPSACGAARRDAAAAGNVDEMSRLLISAAAAGEVPVE